jgi:hypothetical protein
MPNLTFTPIKLETVVVLRGDKVIGTIKRYRSFKAVLVHVEGLLTAASNRGYAKFDTILEAKRMLRFLEANRLAVLAQMEGR